MPRTRPAIVPAQLERRVYERLLEDILGGVLVRGQQLVEARIAEEFGVSKTPVREALIRLQRDGLVQIRPYRGARVVEPSAHDVVEIFELRLCLEMHIVAELAHRRPPDVLARLRKSVDDSRRALKRRTNREFIKSLSDFNAALASGCENRRMLRVLSELRNVLDLIGTTSLRAPGREHRSIDEHEAILRAIERGDSDAAREATRAHILSVQRDSLANFDSETEHEEPAVAARASSGG
jgi:DNA-binding GntR family transcriptional regulator